MVLKTCDTLLTEVQSQKVVQVQVFFFFFIEILENSFYNQK